MLLFKDYALKLIKDYRLLIGRHLEQDRTAYLLKLEQMGLNKNLQQDSEISLYEILHAIYADLEAWAPTKSETASWHSGSEVFLIHLKNFLGNYTISNQQIIHVAQNASKALVDVIQLVNLPPERVDNTVIQKIRSCCQQIIRYGSADQRQTLIKALKKQVAYYNQHFRPILEHYEHSSNLHDDGAAWGTV